MRKPRVWTVPRPPLPPAQKRKRLGHTLGDIQATMEAGK